MFNTRGTSSATTSKLDVAKHFKELKALLKKAHAEDKINPSHALTLYREASNLGKTYIETARLAQANGIGDPIWRTNYGHLEHTYGATITDGWDLLLAGLNTSSEYQNASERFIAEKISCMRAFKNAELAYKDAGSHHDKSMRQFIQTVKNNMIPKLQVMFKTINESKDEKENEEEKCVKTKSHNLSSSASLRKLMKRYLPVGSPKGTKRKSQELELEEEKPSKMALTDQNSRSPEADKNVILESVLLRLSTLEDKVIQLSDELRAEKKQSEEMKSSLLEAQRKLEETFKPESKPEEPAWKSMPRNSPDLGLLSFFAADDSSEPEGNSLRDNRSGFRSVL